MILAMADGDGGIDGESVVMSGIGIDVLVGALAIVIAETNVHEKKVCSACDIHITYSIVGDGGGSAGVSGCEEMDDDSSIIDDSLRANWTPSQDQYFIDLLLDHVRRGNKTGHVFSKQAWAEMIAQFNTKFGFKYDTDVLKNRFKRFRKQYNEIKMLVEQSGFKWDETRHMVTADDNVWAEFIKAHPDMVPYRTRVVLHYNELCIICGHAVADGRYSLSCFDINFENEVHHLASHIFWRKPLQRRILMEKLCLLITKMSQTMHIKRHCVQVVIRRNIIHYGKHEEAFDSGVDKKKHLSSRKKEAALHSGGAKNISEQKRLQPDMPQTFQLSKKARRLHGGMADVLREMAVAVTSLTKKQKQENSISTEDVIDVLQAIPDMDDDLLLDACDLLEDEKRARMFLALDAPLRKKWLMRKLRP
uniref:Myb/SANT-like domain-containing protein n=1 Tax=Fagus sylvatica TaxID=28930 RepID=A0A2N9H5D7_FAGSY